MSSRYWPLVTTTWWFAGALAELTLGHYFDNAHLLRKLAFCQAAEPKSADLPVVRAAQTLVSSRREL